MIFVRLLVIFFFTALISRGAERIPLTEKELTLPNYKQFTLRDGLPLATNDVDLRKALARTGGLLA